MRLIAVIALLALALGASPSATGPIVAREDIVAYGPLASGSGWLATAHHLYFTLNQGAAWEEITPLLGSGVVLGADFVEGGYGWVVSGQLGSDANALSLARTSDLGAHWNVAQLILVTGSQEAPIGSVHVDFWSPEAGSVKVRHISSSNFNRWSEWQTADGGATWVRTRRAEEQPVLAEPDALFAGETGWQVKRTGSCSMGPQRICEQVTQLRTTADGGRSWHNAPLPEGVTESRQWSVADVSATAAGINGGSRTATAIGQGFDKCEIPTLDQMYDWRWSSPYSVVNLYIGGENRACPNSALSAEYLRSLYGMGWAFIPTWVGPQAPCIAYSQSYDALISWDPGVAWSQGQTEASEAAFRLWQLGLTDEGGGGSIVYFDMEHFNAANLSCSAAVQAFISGWTEGLRARGNLAGVYSTGAPLRLFANLQSPPDAIWAAHWLYPSYNPGATVWDVYAISNDVWSNHQRLRQYAANSSYDPPETWTETWGYTTMSIDSDVLDGPVAVVGPAPATPTPTPTATTTPTRTPTPTATRTHVPITPTAWVYLPVLVR